MPSTFPSVAAPVTPADTSAQRATRLVFLMAGFSVAAWAPLVPFAKTRLGLDEGALGLLVLCLGGGSIVAMPLAGALAARFGCRPVILVAAGLICLTLPLLASVSYLPLLVLGLGGFGAAIGSVDCVINIQAILVERAGRRPMMSGFHGLFSVGGIVGAGGVSILLSTGVSLLGAALGVVVGTVSAIVLAAPGLLSYSSERQGSAFAVPHGIVLLIGGLCFILFLAEGSVLDWSAVFLTSQRGMAPSHGGVGYAAFALTMTVGRLTGDTIVRRFGSSRVMALGGCTAGAGLALVSLVPSWQAGVLGFVLVGAGCSNIVPVLFTAVGSQKALPEDVAVPAITTLGYLGMLAGPASIGFIGRTAGLPVAFLVVAVLLFVVAACANVVRR